MPRALDMNRRDWLKAAGGLVVGFSLGSLPTFAQQTAPSAPDGRPLDPKEVDSFLTINPDSSVTVYTSKVDVGTGMRVAIAQMAAEELGVDVGRVSVVDGDTGTCPNTGGTGGSTGLTRGGTAVRQAAATARHALIALGAERLKRPGRGPYHRIGRSARAHGRPRRDGSGRSFGDRRGLSLPVDAKAPLAAPVSYVTVGQSPLRPDVPAKCTGPTNTSRTTLFPGCCTPASSARRRLARASSPSTRRSVAQIPGVRVVRLDSFLAVVAQERVGGRSCGEGTQGHVDRMERPPRPRQPRALSPRSGVVERDQAIVNRGPNGPLGEAVHRHSSGSGAGVAKSTFRRRTSGRARAMPRSRRPAPSPTCAATETTVWTSSQVTYGLRATLARVFGLGGEDAGRLHRGSGS